MLEHRVVFRRVCRKVDFCEKLFDTMINGIIECSCKSGHYGQ